MMWDYGWGGMQWVGMGLMMLFWLLALVGFVLLVVWLARNSQRGGHQSGGYQGGGHQSGGHQGGTENACDIAKQRYARGEIGEEEFDRICQNLRR